MNEPGDVGFFKGKTLLENNPVVDWLKTLATFAIAKKHQTASGKSQHLGARHVPCFPSVTEKEQKQFIR